MLSLLSQSSFCSVPPNTVLQLLTSELVSLHAATLDHLDLSPLPVKSFIVPCRCPTYGLVFLENALSLSFLLLVLTTLKFCVAFWRSRGPM